MFTCSRYSGGSESDSIDNLKASPISHLNEHLNRYLLTTESLAKMHMDQDGIQNEYEQAYTNSQAGETAGWTEKSRSVKAERP